MHTHAKNTPLLDSEIDKNFREFMVNEDTSSIKSEEALSLLREAFGRGYVKGFIKCLNEAEKKREREEKKEEG